MEQKNKTKIINNNKNIVIMNYDDDDTAHAWYGIDVNKSNDWTESMNRSMPWHPSDFSFSFIIIVCDCVSVCVLNICAAKID